MTWYLGIPGSSKTTLATKHAADLVAATGWPVLCLDTQGVKQLDGIPVVRSPVDLIDCGLRLRKNASFMPESDEDFEFIIEEIRRRSKVRPCKLILLIDEAAEWIDSHSRNNPLLGLMRARRHAQVHLLLTTQHASADVPQAAFSCAPNLYIFRNYSKAVLDRIESEWKISRGIVSKLPRGHYLHVHLDFED